MQLQTRNFKLVALTDLDCSHKGGTATTTTKLAGGQVDLTTCSTVGN